MSTRPVIVEPTDRRPSSSTSVRTSPRLRRLSVLTPASPELIARRELAGRVLPASAGCWLMKSARLLVGEVFRMSSSVSTVSGVGAAKPSRTTRLPVTTMSSTLGSAAAVVAGAAVCVAGVWAAAIAGIRLVMIRAERLGCPARRRARWLAGRRRWLVFVIVSPVLQSCCRERGRSVKRQSAVDDVGDTDFRLLHPIGHTCSATALHRPGARHRFGRDQSRRTGRRG